MKLQRGYGGGWTASTDEGNYQGAGESPLDAVVDLVENAERAGAIS